jgi:NAD(P)-dependent dehydrogenase (short-subunit alcohol dehydrogenase family)
MSFAIYPSLKDRPVFITGGGSGIGAAIVEHFCAQAARVAFVDIDEAASTKLVADIKKKGGASPLFTRCDLRDIAALKKAIADASATLGTFRVLVNNAARDDRHSLDSVTTEYFDERIAVNLRHQFFAAQAVAPSMASAGGGSIVNLGSVSWMDKNPGMPVYLTAKSAVQGLTRGLARDLGPQHIRVNTVVPGWIMTERQIKLWLTPEGERDLMKKQCLPEKLYPPDIARMVLWLAADDSRLVTAQSFIVDGGLS